MTTPTESTSEARSAADRAFFLYQRLVPLFLLVLLAVTWPLWTDQTSFPAVPAFQLLCVVPGFVDQILFALLILSAGVLLVVGPQSRYAPKLWLTLSLLLLGTFLLDQHRFQPWAYQFMVLGIFFGLAPPKVARQLTLWVTLSIYFYSAISKLNPSFVHELGSDFLVTLGSLVGLSYSADNLGHWKWLAIGFPLFELLAFLLLLARHTRKIGVLAACSMHVGLIIVLGPLGLSHSWGVLTWNVFFLLQAILLFWFAEVEEPASNSPSYSTTWIAQTVCGLVLLIPTLELIGLGDPWPAWGLYASHVGRTHLFLPRHVAETLPPDLRKYVDFDSSADLFVPVSLEQWSLDATGAPIYPGTRFSFAAAQAFTKRTQTTNFARLVIESPAGRLQDDRETDTFSGEQFAKRSARFWLNTRPRDAFLSAN